MYNPKFNYSDKLVLNLVKIEHNKTLLHSHDLNYNVRYKLAQHIKKIDIFHAAHSLKLEITLKDAEKVVAGNKLLEIEEPRSTILKNLKNTLDFNRSQQAESFGEFDTSVMLHLNKLLMLQWRETWEASFRTFNEKIDDRWDAFVQYADTSMPINKVKEEVDELIEWHKYSIPTIVPIVRAGVITYRLIEISPFIGANRYTISSIVDFMLAKNGHGAKSYISIFKIFDLGEERLLKALHASKLSGEITPWLDTFTSLYANETNSAREEMQGFLSQEEKSKQQPFLNLSKRQLKVLKYLQNVPTIKREDYCHMMEVSTMTAFRDLNDLVRKKLLKIDGKGRGTKYRLASM